MILTVITIQDVNTWTSTTTPRDTSDDDVIEVSTGSDHTDITTEYDEGSSTTNHWDITTEADTIPDNWESTTSHEHHYESITTDQPDITTEDNGPEKNSTSAYRRLSLNLTMSLRLRMQP